MRLPWVSLEEEEAGCMGVLGRRGEEDARDPSLSSLSYAKR